MSVVKIQSSYVVYNTLLVSIRVINMLASVNEMDVLLSWNFQHIVKLKTKREAVGVNMLMGYGSLEIYTPREVVE